MEKGGGAEVVPFLQGQRPVAALELDVEPGLHLKRRLEYDPQRSHNSVVEQLDRLTGFAAGKEAV